MVTRWQSIWIWKLEFLWVVPLELAGFEGRWWGKTGQKTSIAGWLFLMRHLGKLLQSCSIKTILDSLQGSSETNVSALKSPRPIISLLQREAWDVFPSYQRAAPHSRGCRSTVNIANSYDLNKRFLIFSCSEMFWSQVITWQSQV